MPLAKRGATSRTVGGGGVREEETVGQWVPETGRQGSLGHSWDISTTTWAGWLWGKDMVARLIVVGLFLTMRTTQNWRTPI